MLLNLRGISKSFGTRVLFSDLDLRVLDQDRIALVGANGAGKSTLLDIIAHGDGQDSGTIQKAKDLSIGLLEQEILEETSKSVLDTVLESLDEASRLQDRIARLEQEISLAGDDVQEDLLRSYARAQERFEFLGGYSLEAQARTVLFGLGFSEKDMGRSIEELSGGWRMRVSLARLLLKNPDILLLDEPTNHLDLASVTWLENFLKSYNGAIVFVSHDRAFIDGIATKVAELSNASLKTYIGNYTKFLKERELYIRQLEEKRASQLAEIAHMQTFVDRFRYKATKAKAAQERIREIEKIKAELVEPPPRQAKIHFKFPQPVRTGELSISLENVSKSYGDNTVYADLSISFHRGDKVALVGPNGAGKSTLLKMLAGVLEPDKGKRRLGVHVDIAYFSQHQLEVLDPRKTVYKSISEVYSNAKDADIRRLLGAFLFRGDDVDKLVGVLSGGERSRLALARMLASPAAVLCLDEPTNHLDMQALDVLEHALSNFEGTIVLISHDRDLISKTANRIVEVDSGQITNYDGDFDYYLYKKEQMRLARELEEGLIAITSEATKVGASKELTPRVFTSKDTSLKDFSPKGTSESSSRGYKSKEQRRLEAEERNRVYRTTKKLNDELKTVDEKMQSSKVRFSGLEKLMAAADFYENKEVFEPALLEYAELKEKIEILEDRWLDLSEQIAIIEESSI